MIAPFDRPFERNLRITNEMPGCQGCFFVCLFVVFFCFFSLSFSYPKREKKKIETKRFLNDHLHGIKLPVVV